MDQVTVSPKFQQDFEQVRYIEKRNTPRSTV